jgi:murein DD-endopeptidase MepM/ murein hydrolase activator NlpD
VSRGLGVALLCAAQFAMLVPSEPAGSAQSSASPARVAASNPADVFQLPLPSWSTHCLGFGSEWRYCNGNPLRACANGAVWLHTGVDIVTGIQPVAAAGDGVIVGYMIDSVFRGGVLIRHQTSDGVVITQYWHVWLREGFAVGSTVKRGQAFADVADMGDQTHLHFAVFNGDLELHAWNGALPPSACSGFPAWPYRFIDPTAFIEDHQPEARLPHGMRVLDD